MGDEGNTPFGRYFEPSDVIPDEGDVQNMSNYELPFQMPQFMQSGPPTLAPGGGAEVLPVGMLSDQYAMDQWLTNNGFMPFHPQFQPPGTSPTVTSVPSQHDGYATQPATSSNTIHFYSPPPKSPPDPFKFQPPAHPQIAATPEHDQQNLQLQSLVAGIAQSSVEQSNALHSADRNAVGGSVCIPPPFPLYSASGFDLLSVMSRVHTRRNPTVHLGPVDMTSSFVVVDVRRHDHPIIYCSPNFFVLTGYEEREVVGRNCRFLQAPDGQVQKSEKRRFTSDAAAAYLKKCLSMDKECQTSIVNYKKGGEAFVNLVTVIPICAADGEDGREGEVVYHVGFQIDLTAQPNMILDRIKDGSYMVGYQDPLQGPTAAVARKAGTGVSTGNHPQAPLAISKALQRQLADPQFVASLSPPPTSPELDPAEGSGHPLSSILLAQLPDFLHVVSLKGVFLYVAPSVERTIGYTSAELVGKSLEEFCHPADVVPVMRELKECGEGKVDLLFRARRKMFSSHHSTSSSGEDWVWIECRGRLHIEPGKGRKAIVLSGRTRGMVDVRWEDVSRHGGLTDTDAWGTVSHSGHILSFLPPHPITSPESNSGSSSASSRSGSGTPIMRSPATASMASNQHESQPAAYFLGQDAVDADLVGRPLSAVLAERDARVFQSMLMLEKAEQTSEIPCTFRSGAGGALVLYRTFNKHTSSCPIVFQLKTSSRSSVSTPKLGLSGGNMFAELAVENTSSWQYELEQMRIENSKMVEEISILEHRQQHQQHQQQQPTQGTPRPANNSLRISIPPPALSMGSASNQDHVWAGMKRVWNEAG